MTTIRKRRTHRSEDVSVDLGDVNPPGSWDGFLRTQVGQSENEP
jgi:hypothetical protein